MGAQGVETGTRGTLYFDDFESRRFSYIGTLTDPGVDDPQATNQAGWFGRTYQYSATIPHAVVSVTSEQSSVDSYEYDANGNMTCRVENGVTYTHTYNAENRASSIAKRSGDCATGTILESWSFVYDGDGTRVGTVHFTGTSGTPDSTTSYYMGGQFEVKDSAVKKYYSIAGMMVATQDASGLQYLLTDHLGSTVAVTNSSGTLTSQQRYLPFGGTRAIPNSPILGTDFGYTGQRLLDSGMGGIMDYKARFYSPALSRFLQPDTIIPDQSNPQSWNRYSYVENRPVIFNDPSGREPKYGCYISSGNTCLNSNGTTIREGRGRPVFSAGELGLEFKHDRTDGELRGDITSFLIAATQEANNQYDIYCSNQPAGNCGYASPADLYVATHGTTVITFSNSSGPDYCQRNTNSGQEGVICYSQSFGDIDPVLAAHELAHWFNHLVDPTGQADAYDDLASARATPGFPDIDVAITAGYAKNGGSDGEDFANMYSMWVFNSWPDPSIDTRRRQFMNDYMYLWLVRLLNK